MVLMEHSSDDMFCEINMCVDTKYIIIFIILQK